LNDLEYTLVNASRVCPGIHKVRVRLLPEVRLPLIKYKLLILKERHYQKWTGLDWTQDSADPKSCMQTAYVTKAMTG